jgi:NADPH-dependent 2,4-dienoyl-CoA reductase/sulfur reductase-like enzyme
MRRAAGAGTNRGVTLGAGLRVAGTQRDLAVRFTFDGVPRAGFAGETLAAALLAAGIRVLGRSAVDGTSRGLFCAMGSCQECVLLVDGTPREACLVALRDGMEVRSRDA